MEEKKTLRNPPARVESEVNGLLFCFSVLAFLTITALYIKEQTNDEGLGIGKIVPVLLLIPAMLMKLARKKISPQLSPVPSEFISPTVKNSLLPPLSPSHSDANTQLSAALNDSKQEVTTPDEKHASLAASSSISCLQEMCNAMDTGATLLTTVYLVESLVSLTQNVLVESKTNQLFTYTTIAGLATGVLLDLALNAAKTYEICLISDLKEAKPEPGKIYIGIEEDCFTYIIRDNGRTHSGQIPHEILDPKKFPDSEYPTLLITALKENLPEILKFTSKKGHTSVSSRIIRLLDNLTSSIRNDVLLAMQFVLSTMIVTRLPAVKNPLEACMSSVWTGYNWSKFLHGIIGRIRRYLLSSEVMSPTTAIISVNKEPDEKPMPAFACPALGYDLIRGLGGAVFIGGALTLNAQHLPDPEGVLNWAAHWLVSVGGCLLGSGAGGPIARRVGSHDHKDKFAILATYVMPLLISPTLNSRNENILYTSFLVLAGFLCRIAQEIADGDAQRRLAKRASTQEQIKNIFTQHRNSENMRHLLLVLDSPAGPLLPQHKNQYFSLKKKIFNAIFFAYMIYKLALIKPTWQAQDLKNAWIHIITAVNIAAMLLGFNYFLPMFCPAKDSVDPLPPWSWKKFIYEPNFTLIFHSCVAFFLQFKPSFVGKTSEVLNTLIADPIVLALVGQASGLYLTEERGVERLEPEDIKALNAWVINGRGKIHAAIIDYTQSKYLPELRTIISEAGDEVADEEKETEVKYSGFFRNKLPESSASAEKKTTHRTPLLGFFSNRSEPQPVIANRSHADIGVYDTASEPVNPSPHEIGKKTLSGLIRTPAIKRSF